MTSGLILFAHGARDPRWAEPFEAVAARVRRLLPAAEVRLAYLELMTPDLASAAHELVAAGCASVAIVPLFLGTGGHVRRDLPRLVENLLASHPGVSFDLRPAVGEAELVIDAIAAAAAGAAAPT
jgi:sirohydrochlorin cobaltochelatase